MQNNLGSAIDLAACHRAVGKGREVISRAKNLAELKPEDAAAVRQFLDSGTTEELLIQFPIGEKSAPKSGAQPIGVTRLQESALSPALAERLEARKPTTSAPSEPMSLGDRLRQGIKIGMGIDIPKPEEMETAKTPESTAP